MSDQVVSVRLRRNATSTPWGFRMQGGYEYGTPLKISQVNPKSLSHRLGLRLADRILAVGPVQAHNMSHEQAKMEIIRAGNELDLIVERSASAVIDQPDSRPVHRSQRPDPVEESTEYRGYTNPNVQSRSFKILQESLSYSEANEEGIVLPTGNTPGEGIVRKAYSEGRRRLEELSELNPRNFTEEGSSPYRVSEHYNIKEESLISDRSRSDGPTAAVASAKVYDGSEPRRRKRPTVDVAQSSVLSPAAGQQQYLQQAHEYYGTRSQPEPQRREQPSVNIAHSSVLSPAAGQQQYLQQAHQYYETKPQPEPQRRERPTVNISQSSVLSPAAGQQQYLQQAQQYYETKSAPTQQFQTRPEPSPQQSVVHRQRPKERQLKLVNYQFEEQYGQLKTAPGSVQAQQQGHIIQTNRQKAVVSPQKSGDFIPATEMVESVAADLHLKIVSPDTGPQPSEQIIKSVEQTVKSTEEIAKPKEQIVKQVEQTVKPEEQIVKPVEKESAPPTGGKSVEITEEKGKVIQASEVKTIVVQSDITETNKQTVSAKTVTNEAVNKFADDLSVSVVTSAQQSMQESKIAATITSDVPDGCSVSKETAVKQVQNENKSKVTQKSVSISEQQIQPVDQELKEVKFVKTESVEGSIELSTKEKEPIQTEKVIQKEEQSEQVSINESKSDQQLSQELNSGNQAAEEVTVASIVEAEEIHPEPGKETIPATVTEEIDVVTELSVGVTESADTDREIKNVVAVTETQEQASFTVEEVKEVNTQPESQSTEVLQTSEVEIVTQSDNNETGIVEQTISIETDMQSEDQTFSISVDENRAPEETISENAELTFEVSANETETESTVAFEISTDAEVSLDVSSDINFTTDANADNTTDESEAAITIALEPATEEVESTDVTISVAEKDNESKPDGRKETVEKPKENGQNNSKPTKAKFVDSQGGIAARLARLKQK